MWPESTVTPLAGALKMRDRKCGTNDVRFEGPNFGTGKCKTDNEGRENVGQKKAGVENAGPENAGLKMQDWKLQDMEYSEFHIHACIRDTMLHAGAITVEDYTETVTLAITRAQIVS